MTAGRPKGFPARDKATYSSDERVASRTEMNGNEKPIITLDPADLTKKAADLGIASPKATKTINEARKRGAIRTQTSLKSLAMNAALVKTSNVYLIVLVLDDSTSVRDAGAEDDVIEATNLFIRDLKETKGSSDVLIAIMTLNRGVIREWERIEDAREISSAEYSADGGTPLYSTVVQAHEMVVNAAAELVGAGHQARSITLTITDGDDTGSSVSLEETRVIIEGLHETRHHIIAGMYRGNAKEGIFLDMGMMPNWIVPAGSTGAELMQAIRRLSQASSSASKSTKAFDRALDEGVPIQTL